LFETASRILCDLGDTQVLATADNDRWKASGDARGRLPGKLHGVVLDRSERIMVRMSATRPYRHG
jgi:hypothetical protein